MKMKLYNNINTSVETIKVYISKYFYISFWKYSKLNVDSKRSITKPQNVFAFLHNYLWSNNSKFFPL